MSEFKSKKSFLGQSTEVIQQELLEDEEDHIQTEEQLWGTQNIGEANSANRAPIKHRLKELSEHPQLTYIKVLKTILKNTS